MKVQAECVEILDFLLAEIREIESINNREEINSNDLSKLQLPLSEWDDVLKSNGFETQLLQEFFLSDQVLGLWKGEEELIDIYQQAIEKSLTTGDFLVLLFSQDPKFLESLLNLVSPLLSERVELMEVAAGKLGKKGDILVGLGAYYGTALLVGSLLAYKYRKTWVPNVSEEFSSSYQNILKFIGRTERNQLQNEVTDRIQDHIETKFEDFWQLPEKDKFKVASEALIKWDPRSGRISKGFSEYFIPIMESAAEVSNIHRIIRVDRSNPAAFLEQLKKDLSSKFGIRPQDYIADLEAGFELAVAEAQRDFALAMDRIVTDKIKYLKRLQGASGSEVNAFIKDEEIKLGRRTLIQTVEENWKDGNLQPWLERFNKGGKIVTIEASYKARTDEIVALEEKHKAILLEIAKIESEPTKLPDLKTQAQVLNENVIMAEQLVDEGRILKEQFGIKLQEQILLCSKLDKDVLDLEKLDKEEQELEKLTNESFEKLRDQELEIQEDMKLLLKRVGGSDPLNRFAALKEQAGFYEQYVQKEELILRKLQEMAVYQKTLRDLKESGVAEMFKNNKSALEIALGDRERLIESVKTSTETFNVATQDLKKAKQAAEQNAVQIKDLEARLAPFKEKLSSLSSEINKAKQALGETAKDIEVLNNEFRILDYDPAIKIGVNDAVSDLPEDEKIASRLRFLHLKNLDCQVYNLCSGLATTLDNERNRFIDLVRNADAEAFKGWIEEKGTLKLEKIQGLYGKEIAALVNGKANINAKLQDIELEAEDKIDDSLLDDISTAIDSELSLFLGNKLDECVKHVAKNMLTALWREDGGFDNVVIDEERFVANAADDLLL